MKTKTILIILSLAVVLAIVSIVGRNRSSNTDGQVNRCNFDGTPIKELYQVDAFFSDQENFHFCSISCAASWLSHSSKQPLYLTVRDEVEGKVLDAALGHYVTSSVYTVPEAGNRLHVFANSKDAIEHANLYQGTNVANPFGVAVQIPETAKMKKFRIAIPNLPDALPMKFAVLLPIFKENRIETELVVYQGDEEGLELIRSSSVDGILCDFPVALQYVDQVPETRIVKNILRANPYRALYGIMAKPGSERGSIARHFKGGVAIPASIGHHFYKNMLLRSIGFDASGIKTVEVESDQAALAAVNSGKSSAAMLRAPFLSLGEEQDLELISHDRNLPWMSVLLLKMEAITKNEDDVKRFLFALEQSVLALNLKSSEYIHILREHGGLPEEIRQSYYMPHFEGGNAPSFDEFEPVEKWLLQTKRILKKLDYDSVVDPRFLPNPDKVGLSFCCS